MSDGLVSDIGPFAIVPKWVLLAPISDRAVRLAGILALHADRDTGESYPGRRLLASELRASRDSVDRALRELVDLGAVDVEARRDDAGDQASNRYRIKFAMPEGVAAVVRLPGRTDAATGGRRAAAGVAAPVRHRTITTVTRDVLTSAFEERFWANYPRHVNKQAALRAWRKLNPDESLIVVLVEALRRQVRRWESTQTEERYIPHPASWLNGRRWEDAEPRPGVVQAPVRTVATGPYADIAKDFSEEGAA